MFGLDTETLPGEEAGGDVEANKEAIKKDAIIEYFPFIPFLVTSL